MILLVQTNSKEAGMPEGGMVVVVVVGGGGGVRMRKEVGILSNVHATLYTRHLYEESIGMCLISSAKTLMIFSETNKLFVLQLFVLIHVSGIRPYIGERYEEI